MFALFTDTDTDITLEVANKYGYHLISMPYTVNGQDVFPYQDFEVFDDHAFYDMMRKGAMPSTAAISTEKYLEYFEPYFEKGEDILYVHFSRAMTMTFNNMDKAVEILKEKYPERKFYAIDTKAITTLSYVFVLEIGELYKQGKTPEEIVAWADAELYHYAIRFVADDLKFFHRSGRVSGIAAMMGGLIGIRPVIYISEEGKMVSCGKEKGRVNAINRIVTTMEEIGDDVANHRIIIAHTDAPELVEMVKAKIIEKYGDNLNIEVVAANPTAGSHCGPNTVGVVFHAIKR